MHPSAMHNGALFFETYLASHAQQGRGALGHL